MSAPGMAFCEAYNRYQTLWAYLRLKGWNGERPELVPEIVEAELKMRAAFDALHVAETGEPRPNYSERARRRLLDERK